jgi:hypothetical protein
MKKEIKVINDPNEIDEEAIEAGFIHPTQHFKPAKPAEEPKPEEKKKKQKKAQKEQ